MPERPVAASLSSDRGPVVRLLGQAALRRDGRLEPFTTERPYQLLAYLACRGGWVRRDELAEALFADRSLEAARSNLRKVLFLARKLGDAAELDQREDRLQWRPDSDVLLFEQACDAQRWAEALAAYGGPLLEGLEAEWPEALRLAVAAERHRLERRWHDAATRVLDAPADPAARAALARALLRDDPLNDRAVQALMEAQRALGEPAAVRATLAEYAQRLKEELGLEPSAALRALARVAEPAATGAAARPAPPPAALIGRRLELAQIAERLADPACRVLTLLGPGGVGKTALARAALDRHAPADSPGPRSAWVPLADLSAPETVPGRIAESLGEPLPAADDGWAALARQLGTQPFLLVLDNLEHLSLAAPLASLLAACPQLRLLATSRAALGIDGEWRMPLSGMPLPDAEEADPEILRHNDAIRLFEARALPLVPGFDLGAEAADVARLVREVEALPLAVELLAGWRRLMPVADILLELRQSLELLDTSAVGDRSVRASFERSWERLSPLQQAALAGIAILPEPLDRAMAREVLRAPLPVLASLVDQSLLRTDAAGWTLHPLIRRFAADRGMETDALRARHAAHVTERIARHGVMAGTLPSWLLALGEHAVAAWVWARHQRRADLLDMLAPCLAALYEARGQVTTGVQAMEAAREALAPRHGEENDANRVGLHAIEGARAHLLYLSGQLDAASDLARRLCEREGAHERVRLGALNTMARVHWQRGELPQARVQAEQAMALALGLGDRVAEGRLWRQLALIDKAEGRYDVALAGYQEALVLLERSDDPLSATSVQNNIGNLLRSLGRGDEARGVLLAALARARRHELRQIEPFLLTNLAFIDEDASRPVAALETLHQAVEVARRHGEPMILAAALLGRARVGAGAGRPADADWRDLHEALAIGRRLQSPSLLAQCVASAGAVVAERGEPARAAALLAWGAGQPSLGRAEADAARRRLVALPLGPDEREDVARAWPPTRPLDDLLALLPAAPLRDAP